MQRGNLPFSAKSTESGTGEARGRQVEAKFLCCGSHLVTAHRSRQHVKVRITGVGNGRDNTDLPVAARQPTTAGLSRAIVRGVAKLVSLAIGQSGKRLHQGPHGNWALRVIPV